MQAFYFFIPPFNAIGSHADAYETKQNPENSCFCIEEQAEVELGLTQAEAVRLLFGYEIYYLA